MYNPVFLSCLVFTTITKNHLLEQNTASTRLYSLKPQKKNYVCAHASVFTSYRNVSVHNPYQGYLIISQSFALKTDMVSRRPIQVVYISFRYSPVDCSWSALVRMECCGWTSRLTSLVKRSVIIWCSNAAQSILIHLPTLQYTLFNV